MNRKKYKILVVFFYLLSLFILLYFIKIRLTPNVYLKTHARLIFLFFVCIMIYINGYILVKKLNYSKKILKIHLIIYFLIYTVTVFTLTLFDEIYGRQGFILIRWDKDLLDTYLKTSFNIIPFNTVKLFINGYLNNLVSLKNFIINIIGNICAFMPYGVFLPLIFNKMTKFKNFIITMLIIVISVELLQFITMSGSCDIDDLILNILGVSIVYLLLKIKFINNFVHKFFLFE